MFQVVSMPTLTCPVCGGVLTKEERTLRCEKRHSFDLARQGYVNLLMSNRSSAKRHGDDKAMVLSRQAFLEKGYYAPLRDALCRLALAHTEGEVELLDVGCGEGWYTAGVKAALENGGRVCRSCGLDISKDALIQCARRKAGIELVVGSVNALPVADGSCTLLLNVFAPHDDGEFRRVLAPGGVYLKVVPLEEHLMELKAAVYDRPYENPVPAYAPDGFEELAFEAVRYEIGLDSAEDIQALFMMTPYYYKTGRRDQEKLAALSQLRTRIAFGIYGLRRV